jgi:hypothetical protein
MTVPSEAPRGGLGRLIAAGVLFGLAAPIALAALPLAALLLVSRPRSAGELLVAGVAGGFALWWLLVPGALPEQMLRAAAVVGTAAFVGATLWTKWAFTHRALLAASIAVVAVSALLLLLGSSWEELRWWVEHQAGLSVRAVIGMIAAGMGGETSIPLFAVEIEEMEAWLGTIIRWMADFFPAVTMLELLGGFAFATAVYGRTARRPRCVPLSPLRQFRFNEHLGWAAVIPLAVILLPKLAAAKLAAANVLLIACALYALRGLAVAAFGFALLGTGGFFLWAVLAVIFFLMLPVVVGGSILVGVLDAGLNLRRRWTTPPASR